MSTDLDQIARNLSKRLDEVHQSVGASHIELASGIYPSCKLFSYPKHSRASLLPFLWDNQLWHFILIYESAKDIAKMMFALEEGESASYAEELDALGEVANMTLGLFKRDNNSNSLKLGVPHAIAPQDTCQQLNGNNKMATLHLKESNSNTAIWIHIAHMSESDLTRDSDQEQALLAPGEGN